MYCGVNGHVKATRARKILAWKLELPPSLAFWDKDLAEVQA